LSKSKISNDKIKFLDMSIFLVLKFILSTFGFDMEGFI